MGRHARWTPKTTTKKMDDCRKRQPPKVGRKSKFKRRLRLKPYAPCRWSGVTLTSGVEVMNKRLAAGLL
jgi:hypothetical protein